MPSRPGGAVGGWEGESPAAWGEEWCDRPEQVAETLGPVGKSSGPSWERTRVLRALGADGGRTAGGESEVEVPL